MAARRSQTAAMPGSYNGVTSRASARSRDCSRSARPLAKSISWSQLVSRIADTNNKSERYRYWTFGAKPTPKQFAPSLPVCGASLVSRLICWYFAASIQSSSKRSCPKVSKSVPFQHRLHGALTSLNCSPRKLGISCQPMATCFYDAEFERNLRGKLSSKSIVRSTLIKTAAALRVDELALALRRWLVSGGQSPQMLVVEMHETPQQDEALLRQQLDWVSRHFTLVDLPTFVALWQEYRANPRAGRNNKPPLLFTFDDGRLNNYTVAAPVLESYGTRGVFFVVPEFVQCSPQQARHFYYSHIDTRQLPPSLPGEETL